MSNVSPSLRADVAKRAGERCEYCGLAQVGQEAAFHVDHVVPISENGPTTADNLALACVSCSLRKWAKLTAPDPESAAEVPLFNPRSQKWSDHFRWDEVIVVPLTSTGRATVAGLAMNRPLIVDIRREEIARGRHPPE